MQADRKISAHLKRIAIGSFLKEKVTQNFPKFWSYFEWIGSPLPMPSKAA